MKTDTFSTVLGLVLVAVAMVATPLSASADDTVGVQVRVIGARGKAVANVPLRACEVIASATTCGAIFDEAFSNRNGTAILRIPHHALPHGFRVEPADLNHSNLVVSYLSRMGCIQRFTKEYAPVAMTCDYSRSTTSAFQPAMTADTYNLGASQIRTVLGKKP